MVRRLAPGSGSFGGSEAWLRRGLRALLVSALAVLLLLGLRDVVRPFTTGRTLSRVPVQAGQAYPREVAEVFAARFAMAYLTYDSAHPQVRRQALQPYLPDNADPALGWDGQGRQTAIAALPSGIEVRGDQLALITVAVQVDGGRWVYLVVPIAADPGGLVVEAAPALVAPPGRASWRPPAQGTEEDSALESQLRPSLTAFFGAYARSSASELAYYTAPGALIGGLGGEVDFGELQDLVVEQGPPDRRQALAGVRWRDPRSGGSLVQRYRLELVQVDGKWLVRAVSPAA